MKKSILYISVYDPHVPYTGAGVRGGEFVTNLSNYFSVDLIYMEGSGHSGDRDLEKKFNWRVKGANEIIRIPFSKKGYFLYSSEMLKAAENLIRINKYNIIIADYGSSAYYGLKLYNKYKLPFIYCSHNIEYQLYLGKAKQDFRRYLLLPWIYHLEKSAVKKTRLLVPISKEDADFYSKWTERQKMHVIPQCFNDSMYNPYHRPQKNYPKIVLFFGNYNISANRDAVYTVYNIIINKVVCAYPNVKFQFIGANPPRDINHPQMEFLGFVENLDQYIKQCDVVISPILSGWGMPTKIVESLACGKPIVATEIAARTIARNYKTLSVVDIQEFPDAIVNVLIQNKPVDDSDFELLKQEYTWSEKIKKFAAIINCLV